MANGENNLPPDPSNYDPRSPLNKYAKEDAKNAQELTSAARTLTEELKDQLGIRSRLNETKRETLNIARDLTRSAQENTVEIGNSGNIERQIAKDKKRALAIERERQDIIENLGPHQLDHARRIYDLTSDIQTLNEQMAEASEEEKKSILKKLQSKEKILMVTLQTADADTQRLAVLKGMENVNDKLIQQRLREAEIQQDISDKMGVTGALVKGTGALMERLGMRSGIFQDAMKASAEEMRRMAEETVRGTKNFSKMEIMLKGFSELGKGFSKALFDPFTIITAIVSKFFEINKATTEFQNLTGQNVGLQAAHNGKLATAAEVIETMSEFTKETGLNAASIFDSDTLGRMAEAQNLLGLSAKESAKLGLFSKVSGESFRASQEAIVAGVNGINGQLNASVAHGQVMRDVANTSEDIAISLGGQTGKIASAAAAARALGLDLQKVNDIADGLLNFEESISNELEAQLLTGKNINMSKARELALNNDLEGLAKELANQGINAAEFAGMNRIEQEAIAKSLGLSRNELGKMVAAQAAQGEITKDQAAKMQGMTLEQLEQAEAAESLKKAFSKIAEPLASILNTLAPILTAVAKIVSFVAPVAPYFFLAYKGVKLLNSGLIGNIKNMGALLTKSKLFGKMYKGGQFMPGGGRAAKGGQRAGGLFSSLKDKILGKKDKITDGVKSSADKIKKGSKATKGVSPAKNLKSFLTNLGQGLRQMAGMKVLQGALNLIPASLGLTAMIPGVVGAKLLSMVKGPSLLTSMSSLAQGLKAMASGKVFLGAAALGLASAAFLLAIPASAGMALLSITGPLAASGIYALIPALEALGTAMLSGVGALGLAALLLTMVAMGAQAALFGAAMMMVGLGVKFAAEGFSLILSQLGGLVEMLPSLFLIGPALFGIAGGLAAIAISGLAAIPALAAMGTLAVAATPLIALGNLFGGEDSENSGFENIEKKLDTLIGVVSMGGDVYLDSDKIGRTQSKALSRLT